MDAASAMFNIPRTCLVFTRAWSQEGEPQSSMRAMVHEARYPLDKTATV